MRIQLSPAYDMLPVNVILPEDKEQMAHTVNGKKRNIRKKDFMHLSESFGMNRKAAINIINDFLKKEATLAKICDESYLSSEQKQSVKDLIDKRIDVLK